MQSQIPNARDGEGDEVVDETPATSPRTGLIGLYFFLAALAMLFASGMLGYVIIRTNPTLRGTRIHLPAGLWLSTVLILLSSLTIHLSIQRLRAGEQRGFRRWLLATLALAVAFVAVQGPSLWMLLSEHIARRQHGLAIYGLIFFLVLLHALHVLGGIVALARVNIRASSYDTEQHAPVRYAAIYWHFLDAVWLVMFTVMQMVG